MSKTGPIIETPQGKIITITTKNGKVKAKLEWDTKKFVASGSGGGRRGFNDSYSWQGRFNRAQWFVDNEVLRYCDKFTPFRTGMLIKSSALGTDLGSGLVQWIAPYARWQYYAKRKPGSTSPGDPLRGPFWFHRMWAVHGRTIINGMKRLFGGGN